VQIEERIILGILQSIYFRGGKIKQREILLNTLLKDSKELKNKVYEKKDKKCTDIIVFIKVLYLNEFKSFQKIFN